MIIQRLDLKAFGRFTDVSLDLSAGPRRFHLIYGPNESGKSTSLRAITSLLFGMDHVTDDNYLHNHAQMRVGGVLVDSDGTALQCVRRRGRKGTLRDADDNEPIDETLMTAMLGGIDRETFLTRFGISHQELVDGGAAILAGEGDLGEILFAAGAGVSRLREIQSHLNEARDKLFMPRGSRSINQALKELDEKRKELRKIQVQPTTFMDLRDDLGRKRAAATERAAKLERATIELAKLRAYQQALPLLPQWRSDIEQLAALAATPRLDEAFSERRREADSQREIASELHARLTKRLNELMQLVESMPVDAVVLEHQSEIETVFQELAIRDKADRDRIDLLRVRRNLDRKVVDVLRELSVDVSLSDEDSLALDDAVERLRVSDAVRTRVHELSGQYERLVQQRDDADDRLKTLTRRHRDVEERLIAIGTPPDPATLSTLLDEMGSPVALLDSAAEQHESCQRLRQRSQDLLSRLSGFDGDCRQAARLQLPAASLTDRLAADMLAADAVIQSLQTRHAAVQQQREQLNRQLVAQRKSDPLPTAQELSAARQQRDAIIDQIANPNSQRVSQELIDGLRRQVSHTDQIVDTIRAHHQTVHQRAADEENLAATDREITEIEAEIESAVGRFNVAQDEWNSLWKACGIVAAAPPQMQRWINDHEKLVALVHQWEAEEARYEQLQQRIKRTASRLQSALDGVNAARSIAVGSFTQTSLFDSAEPESLDTLYDEAVTLRSELDRGRQEFESMQRKRAELLEDIPDAQTRLETCQRAFDQWQADWQRITSSFADANQSLPSVVASMLSRIDDLCAKKRERDILSSRIRSISEDDSEYSRRVSRLASALEMTCQPQKNDAADVGATVKVMYTRLLAERSAAGQRSSLKSEVDQTSKQLSEALQQCHESKVVLRQLCAEAGAKSADVLPEVERRSRQRNQIEASLRDLENQLSLLAGDDSVTEFVDSARQQQPALLSEEILRSQQTLNESRQQLLDLQQEIGALQHEMDQLNGSGRASELHQSIQFLIGQIGGDAEEYARLRIASMMMRRAIEHYRRENQNPVLTYAEEMFQRLTCGEYQSLKVDYNTKGKSVLFGGTATGPDVPVPCMSVGTADALYLALRLASLQHQLRHGQPIPLIVDDCLIQLDDERAVAALEILSELSTTTQVVLFTHHRHLLELATNRLESDDFHVHRL